jgi:transglutaminase-like putative cysteine protease
MRLRISHLTTYSYSTPATSAIQVLRLTPRNYDGQHVIDWRIDVSSDCRLDQHEDAFGNIAHAFTADGPLDELKVLVEGEVETRDTNGVVLGAVERFPPSLYLRETALTLPDEAIAGLAASVRADAGSDDLKLLHLLLEQLHRDVQFDTEPTQVTTTAAETYALKRGVCQDLTHVFLSAARSAGVPARYVSGYFRRNDGVTDQDAGHAWAEAFVTRLGWVAFDPANGMCATDAHIRVAVGLDYLGAAPVRGTRYGGMEETLSVLIRVIQAASQTQN